VGTHIYQTSNVFSAFYKKFNPKGFLVTADIGTYNRAETPPEHVVPVMVYPHIYDVESFHGGLAVWDKNFKKVLKKNPDTAKLNSSIILEKFQHKECGCDCHENISIMHFVPCCYSLENYKPFDFTFIDGCHSEVSIKKDLEIAKQLIRPDGYILIDDINDKGKDSIEQHDYYQNYLKPRNRAYFYEFEDWLYSNDQYAPVGMALIKAGDLIL
jgi:hypothetical protein